MAFEPVEFTEHGEPGGCTDAGSETAKPAGADLVELVRRATGGKAMVTREQNIIQVTVSASLTEAEERALLRCVTRAGFPTYEIPANGPH